MARRISIIFILCLLCLNRVAMGSYGARETMAKNLFHKAKKESIKQKWDEALWLFQELVDNYPETSYIDDAHFWMAYCLEKKPDNGVQAFMAYETFKSDYPSSIWVDDASVHQIALAEELVKNGNDQFLAFLNNNLENKDVSVKQHAALAMGRLGDRRVLPVLSELEDDEIVGKQARDLINKILEKDKSRKQKYTYKPEQMDQLQFKTGGEKPKSFGDYGVFSLPVRYRQYKLLLKRGDVWSQKELIDFGMWTILQDDERDEYFSLSGYDQSEWYRKYWKMRDPTPTTEVNECEEEFKKRVEYARSNFGEFFDTEKSQYMGDQYLLEDRPHAPWDARGELYIKFGEPEFKVKRDLYTERWTYWGNDIIVYKHKTNVYGRALQLGAFMFVVNPDMYSEYQRSFLNNGVFIYQHEYDGEPFKKISVEIEDRTEQSKWNVVLKYSIPSREFSMSEENGEPVIKYQISYVVFNNEMREIGRHESLEVIRVNQDLGNKESVDGMLPIRLSPESYKLSLRLQDVVSKKLAIYSERFDVKYKQYQ